MPINPSSRKRADAWFKKSPGLVAHNVTECPFSTSNEEAAHALSSSKPEFYGRAARIITTSVNESIAAREKRPPLGFIKWTGEIVEHDEIQSMYDFENAFYKTLLIGVQDTIITMRSSDIATSRGAQTFGEYSALHALTKYRTQLKQYGFNDPMLDFQEGISTATSHIAKILPLMVSFLDKSGISEAQAATIIIGSYKPVMRLASLDSSQLVYFDDTYLSNVDNSLFTHTERGTLDFTNHVIQDVLDQAVNHGPTIGCPVLFGHDTTKNLWVWGAEAAADCRLLKPELYQ